MRRDAFIALHCIASHLTHQKELLTTPGSLGKRTVAVAQSRLQCPGLPTSMQASICGPIFLRAMTCTEYDLENVTTIREHDAHKITSQGVLFDPIPSSAPRRSLAVCIHIVNEIYQPSRQQKNTFRPARRRQPETLGERLEPRVAFPCYHHRLDLPRDWHYLLMLLSSQFLHYA